MAEPSKKSDEINALIDASNPFGRKRVESIKADVCTWCGKAATEFRDELSRKEYTISGLCQVCQDETFGPNTSEPRLKEITPNRYCVMKNLREVTQKTRPDLPMFCTVEEHGRGNPVTLGGHSGGEVIELDWDTFKELYTID